MKEVLTGIGIGLAIALVLAAVGFVLYVLSTKCRKDHPGVRKLRSWAYAHRGLHNETRPENSMAAFRAALDGGYGIELDVHLLKDGNLAVIHDHLLARTTGEEGKIEDLVTEDLWNYHLEGTSETIPTFREVLDLFSGKAPIIVELKSDGKNYAELTETACQMLDHYDGLYCLESFDPRCILWLKQNRPDLLRGQLVEDYMKRKAKLPFPIKFCLTHQMFNFLTQPDFVAYRFSDRQRFSNTLIKKLWGGVRVTWTIQSKEEYTTAKREGWIPIFEHFIP